MRPTIAPEDWRAWLAASKPDCEPLVWLLRHLTHCMNDPETLRITRYQLEKIARKRGAE